MVTVAFFWFAGSVITGMAAAARGRGGAAWFFLALLISPLLALIAVLVIPAIAPGKSMRERISSWAVGETEVRCPACREIVRSDAMKCKHCGSSLTPQ